MNVTDSPDTSDSLLFRISDPQDRDAWYEFVSIYHPLIFRVGRRFGLQSADAENLAQDVLQKVGGHVAKWEAGKPTGSFRRWLTVVARNSAIDAIRRIKPDSPKGGTSMLEQLSELSQNDCSSEAVFRQELEREAFRHAARLIRDEFTESTWNAFWRTMVDGESCSTVARQLGKQVGAIYTARSRVMSRLKEQVKEFDWQESVDES